VRYIDTETNEQINDKVDRCNREDKCNYHYTPKHFFEANNIQLPKHNASNQTPKPQPPTSFINQNIFTQTLSNYNSNNFVQFLLQIFGSGITQELLKIYFIGTSKHWQGASIFWQIDTQGKIHTGKIMLYNPTTGKRIKQPFNHITWVHKLINQPQFNLKQCLFGERLIKGNSKPIAIVESEKTAIIASVYLPQFIWLAVGSLSNLNEEKCNVLKGRKVVLFPDLNAFDKWNCQAKTLKHIADFQVSNLLEQKATDEERKQGLDLADYLIRFNWQSFQSSQNTDTTNALLAFDLWLSANSKGGIFQYNELKINIIPNTEINGFSHTF
jgi:hypothetical protein